MPTNFKAKGVDTARHGVNDVFVDEAWARPLPVEDKVLMSRTARRLREASASN